MDGSSMHASFKTGFRRSLNKLVFQHKFVPLNRQRKPYIIESSQFGSRRSLTSEINIDWDSKNGKRISSDFKGRILNFSGLNKRSYSTWSNFRF